VRDRDRTVGQVVWRARAALKTTKGL